MPSYLKYRNLTNRQPAEKYEIKMGVLCIVSGKTVSGLISLNWKNMMEIERSNVKIEVPSTKKTQVNRYYVNRIC